MKNMSCMHSFNIYFVSGSVIGVWDIKVIHGCDSLPRRACNLLEKTV